MTIKTKDQLMTRLADNEERAIVAEDMRDLLDSVRAVGGTMYGSGTQSVNTAWQPFAAFAQSIDTRGLTPDFVTGELIVGPGADGLYAVDAIVSLSFPGNGTLELALTKNGNITPFRAIASVATNKPVPFPIVGSGMLVEGDRIGLSIRGSGSATGSVESCQFRAIRV